MKFTVESALAASVGGCGGCGPHDKQSGTSPFRFFAGAAVPMPRPLIRALIDLFGVRTS